MSDIEKLAKHFSRFPGIGTRQAKRFVYFLLSGNPRFARELSSSITTLIAHTSQCRECRRYFSSGGGPASGRESDSSLCDLCLRTHTVTDTLIVVEKDVDLVNLEKTGVHLGRFFVLGSLIPLSEIKSPIIPPRIGELQTKIEKCVAKSPLKEVILALNATPEGDHTALELKLILKPHQEKYGFTISMLGRGLSTGSELEYADSETIRNALKNRCE